METSTWLLPLFSATTLAALYLFYAALRTATPRAGMIVTVLVAWTALQSLLAIRGFYLASFELPPRFLLAVGPIVLTVLALFLFPAGRAFIDRLPAARLTYLHTIRVPVELCLYGLFIARQIPGELTFEGQNFDILVGLTAPLIGWFGYTRPLLNRHILLGWNLLALGMLINIVIRAIQATPYFYQQFGYEVPNLGVLQFPFVWLPALIVPIVLLSQLTAIRQLTRRPAGATDSKALSRVW